MNSAMPMVSRHAKTITSTRMPMKMTTDTHHVGFSGIPIQKPNKREQINAQIEFAAMLNPFHRRKSHR
jgi:hypothetical protein